MKSRPILFSGAMVRAILDGSKTQTRRIVKPQPDCGLTSLAYSTNNRDPRTIAMCDGRYSIFCPYGQPGDQLWVRETFAVFPWSDGKGNDFQKVLYRADEPSRKEFDPEQDKWKPSIFCKREHSRITLEITAIRCERLREISEAEAIAEGLPEFIGSRYMADLNPVYRYRALWESINGPGSWEANPWVWVVEFRRVKP